MGRYEEVYALIEAQQKKVQEGSAPWVVGEQLKEIALREPASAELLAQDLTVEAMSIVAAEKKIKAYADKHRTGNFAYVSPQVAEGILREFYGLSKVGEAPAQQVAPATFDLTEYLM